LVEEKGISPVKRRCRRKRSAWLLATALPVACLAGGMHGGIVGR
jgi:hypothetical protein